MTDDPSGANGIVAVTDEIALRPVSPDDEAFLRALHASTRADELDMTGWSEQERAAFLDFQFRAQRDDYARRFPGAEHSIVLVRGEPAGRVWAHEGDGELRLLDISLLPDHQGRGVGTAVLRSLQDRARDAGLPLRHTVLTSNSGALRLYQRLGFEIVDSTPTHHLMRWQAERGR